MATRRRSSGCTSASAWCSERWRWPSPPPLPRCRRHRRRRPHPSGAGGRCGTWPSASAPTCSALPLLRLRWRAPGAWLLTTESGAQWLLARVPGLQASGVSGGLLGDFSVQQLDMPLPGEGASLRLQQLRWSAPRIRPGGGNTWLRIGFDQLSAQRIDLWLSSEPSSDSAAPTNLELPLGLDVGALRIDEFHIDGVDTPLRQLRARLSLAADDGALHQVEDLQLSWDRLHLSGRAQVGTRGDLAVDAALDLTQQPAGDADWQAALRLSGPLAAPQLQATLRAQTAASRPAQTLDATRHAAPLCRLAAGRAAGHGARAGPVGAAQRRAAHRAGPGRVGQHAGARPAGGHPADAAQPRCRALERRAAAAAHAVAAAAGPARRPEPARHPGLRGRTRQRPRRGRAPERRRAVEPGHLALRHPAGGAAAQPAGRARARHAAGRPPAARRQRLRCRHAAQRSRSKCAAPSTASGSARARRRRFSCAWTRG